jgi:hypothetical protein
VAGFTFEQCLDNLLASSISADCASLTGSVCLSACLPVTINLLYILFINLIVCLFLPCFVPLSPLALWPRRTRVTPWHTRNCKVVTG